MRTDKDAIIGDLRRELVYGAPNLDAVERACESFLELRKRSRAVTERELAPIDVTVTSDEEV